MRRADPSFALEHRLAAFEEGRGPFTHVLRREHEPELRGLVLEAFFQAAFAADVDAVDHAAQRERGGIRELFGELSRKYRFTLPFERLAVAVNNEFSRWDNELAEGDVVGQTSVLQE